MNWLAFFLMLPHLKPKCLDVLNPGLYRALDVLRILSLLVICALFLRACLREKKLTTPVSLLLGVMEVWICLVTIITRGDFVETCSLAVSIMAIVLLVDLYADRMKELLTALMLNYEWVVYVNLASILMDPQKGFFYDLEYGWASIYFFGPDNWFMYLCIPAVCVALLYAQVRIHDTRKAVHILRALCLIAAAYATILIRWPVTAVAAMVVLAAVLLMSFVPGLCCCATFPVVFVGGIAANLAVAVFRVMETVPFLAHFIQTVLKKSVSLSGRVDVWKCYLPRLIDHLWLGEGNPVGGYTTPQGAMDHLHNQYFDLLALGGLPALMLFVAALLIVGKELTVHRKTPAARIMTACIAALR